MHISLRKVGRKYNFEWIFKGIDFDFTENKPVAVLGSNGSGKSTLMHLLTGHMLPSAGEIAFSHDGAIVPPDWVYNLVSMSGPYLELIEEFTLDELLAFHTRFRRFRNQLSIDDVVQISMLENSRNKPIRYYSSGMKQRVRLSLALLSDSKIVLLDEPAANLDRRGIDWYRSLVAQHSQDRVLVVCSNSQADEHDFCQESLLVDDYKPSRKLQEKK